MYSLKQGICRVSQARECLDPERHIESHKRHCAKILTTNVARDALLHDRRMLV